MRRRLARLAIAILVTCWRSAVRLACSLRSSRRAVDRLLAIDLSALALEMARLRCARLANVRFERRAIPDDVPDGRFDLILASEVLYYLTPADLMDTATACLDRLTPSGSLILCHWLGETDYPLSGSQASDLFGSIVIKALPIHRVLRDDVYRLERFDRL